MSPAPFFRFPFRKYQRMILAQIEAEQSGPTDHKYHLVAPPGSGKTIVGIELINRFGAPAVVFAPTTTIQLQWREKVAMFTESGDQATALTSLDPKDLAHINIFTYQLISTPGESQQRVEDMALQKWADDLQFEGKSENEALAQERIDTLKQNNPQSYRRELAKRYNRGKRDLLRANDVDIEPFLHPNAVRLIHELVAHGVRTVVLDECHHLLDYWAIVLRYLIQKIEDPRVIGLTATLPSPEGDVEFENYTSLLGDVDFEVPTPAVVKEGDLAPYRDLALFVKPTRDEMRYLKNIQDEFEAAVAELTDSRKFRDWVIASTFERIGTEDVIQPWSEFLNKLPIFSVAALRFLRRIQHPMPPELLIPTEAEEKMILDDWATLLERYGLDVLKTSSDKADHQQLKRLRKILLPFGLTLTERGMRQQRSPGDLVLTFSEAKDHAVAHILAQESQAMGDQLRAVVVTDFERMSSGVKRLAKSGDSQSSEKTNPEIFPLDPDAGSAHRVFRHLVEHADTGTLEPILVTGKTLLVDADHGQELLDHFNRYLNQNQLRAQCHYRETEASQILEVTGEGPDWSSRTYVRMVTTVFEKGVTQCLVGTRGIFGEGWDSLSLNTLIDLTSVTTSTSVQQLRGRSIRKDPDWARKVAHNWDVVCVAKEFERGDIDLRRFMRRHNQYWGVMIYPDAGQSLSDAIQTGELPNPFAAEFNGLIVKGICHVSPYLANDLFSIPLKHINFAKHNRLTLRQVKKRPRTYELWKIGEDYSNFSYSVTNLSVRDLKIRTVYTIEETLKQMILAFKASFIMLAITALSSFGYVYTVGLESNSLYACLSVGLVMFFSIIVTTTFNLRKAIRLGRKFLVEQPPDGVLLDAGRALLAALKDTTLVSRNLQMEYVRVVETPDKAYQVLLDYASPEDSDTFVRAYQEMFESVSDQRYLIMRDDSRLPSLAMRPFWFALRGFVRRKWGYKPAYHPVPKILAQRKERALAFAEHWEKYVGGSELIFTRSEEGRKLLLAARAQARPKVKGLAFEIWR